MACAEMSDRKGRSCATQATERRVIPHGCPMIPKGIEALARQLVTDAANRGGFWKQISPDTMEIIVRAVALDLLRDAERAAELEPLPPKDDSSKRLAPSRTPESNEPAKRTRVNVPCPACAASPSVVTFHSRTGAYFWCNPCGHIWHQERPPDRRHTFRDIHPGRRATDRRPESTDPPAR